jgi:hypothetical protein
MIRPVAFSGVSQLAVGFTAKQGIAGLALACALVFALDGAVFRSAAADYDRIRRMARPDPHDTRRKVLIAGNSRSLALHPRLAEEWMGHGDFAVSCLHISLVGAAGLEPATTCLEGRCSIHLSYAPTLPQQIHLAVDVQAFERR